VEVQLIPFLSSHVSAQNDSLSAALTTFHALILLRNKIIAVSKMSGDVIQELHMLKESEVTLKSLTRDMVTGEIYMYAGRNSYKVHI
jgi:hypothetical protein